MKKIEAVIPTSESDSITTDLRRLGVEDIVASEVMATGPKETRCYRGARYDVGYFPRIKLELVTADQNVPGVAEVIVNAIHRAGGLGLSISVSAVEQVIEIEGGWHAPAGVPSPATLGARAPSGTLAPHAQPSHS